MSAARTTAYSWLNTRSPSHTNPPQTAPVPPQTPTSTPKVVLAKNINFKRRTLPVYRKSVTISVGTGDDQQDFEVHESVLTGSSLFFKNALSGDWVEAKTRRVNLREEEPAVFHDYVHFLYTRTLCVKSGTNPGDDDGHDEKKSLLKLYVLAERLQDKNAKNVVIGAMYNCLWGICTSGSPMPNVECIQIAYEGTPTGSPMRRLLVDFYTSYAGASSFKVDGHYPHELMQELTINLLTKRKKPQDPSAMFKDPSVYTETDTPPVTGA